MSEVVKDKFGIVLKHPDRTCQECKRYPCFTGMEHCVCDFAKYGCTYYKISN